MTPLRPLAAALLALILTLAWAQPPQPIDPHLNDFARLLTGDEEAELRRVLTRIADGGSGGGGGSGRW